MKKSSLSKRSRPEENCTCSFNSSGRAPTPKINQGVKEPLRLFDPRSCGLELLLPSRQRRFFKVPLPPVYGSSPSSDQPPTHAWISTSMGRNKKAQEGGNKIALQMQVEERRKVCKFGRLLSSHLTKKEIFLYKFVEGWVRGFDFFKIIIIPAPCSDVRRIGLAFDSN